MLYDIIFALFGHPGDIIVECVEKEGFFKLADDVKLPLPDKDAINQIVKTGHLYKIVRSFCDKVRQSDYCADLRLIFGKREEPSDPAAAPADKGFNFVTKNLINSNGYYVTALCQGIESYLRAYRKFLLRLEAVMVSDPTLPISTFSVLLRDQNETLHTLKKIIVDYEWLGTTHEHADVFSKSRELLEILARRGSNQTSNEVYARLRAGLLEFLKRQLRSWLCYGHLLDPYGEFVVSYRDLKNIDPDTQMPLKTLDSSRTGANPDNDSRQAQYEWNYKFYVRLAKGTHFGPIDRPAAKSILFAGKVVRTLSRSANVRHEELARAADEYIFADWEEVTADREKFRDAVERYQSHVSGLFWNFITKNCCILEQLELFKKVYLMSDDAVYAEFFEDTYDLMAKRCTRAALKAANDKFDTVVTKLSRGADPAEPAVQPATEIAGDTGRQFELVKSVESFNIGSNFVGFNKIGWVAQTRQAHDRGHRGGKQQQRLVRGAHLRDGHLQPAARGRPRGPRGLQAVFRGALLAAL